MFLQQLSQGCSNIGSTTLRIFPASQLLCGGFACDSEHPFLDRRSGDSYSYGFLLTGDFHLCLSEPFSPTIGVELKRTGSEQEWLLRPAGLFLNDGAQKGGIV